MSEEVNWPNHKHLVSTVLERLDGVKAKLDAGDWADIALELRNAATLAEAAAHLQKRLT